MRDAGTRDRAPKRVVQVWFQNARAKEKKGKLALQKAMGSVEIDTPQLPEDCKYCSFKYSHKYSIQDHIFTKSHIMNVRLHLENAASKDNCANDGEFTVPPAPGGSVSADSTTAPPQNLNNNTHLQILQMAGMQMPTSSKNDEENQESLFQQLYGLGNNSAYQQGQYMHHSMFSANGEYSVYSWPT